MAQCGKWKSKAGLTACTVVPAGLNDAQIWAVVYSRTQAVAKIILTWRPRADRNWWRECG